MRYLALSFVFSVTVVTVLAQTPSTIVIHVDDDAAPAGDGTNRFPFGNLYDAIDAARSVTGPVIIKVEPGNYPLVTTLKIDRSLVLRGSTQQIYGSDQWPTGAVVPGTETRIYAANPTLTPLVLVDRGNSAVLSDVSITGFVLQGSTGGNSVQLTRVQGYTIADNIFGAPGFIGTLSIASSGRVSGNHFSGIGAGAVLTGGYFGSPSNVMFQGNRSVRNSVGGVLLNGSSTDIAELGDEVHAIVRDNDLSGNQLFGLRAFVLWRELDAPGDSQSSASVYGLVQNNRIVGNRVGITMDAGLPYRRVGTVCDTRVYSGIIDLQFAGNVLSESLLAPALIAFTHTSAALNPSLLSGWQYLHGATFRIDDRDLVLADARIDHPAADPIIGPCPADAVNEVLQNSLIYNGRVLPNGRNF